MLDLNNPEEAAVLEELHTANRQNSGINFTLAMRNPDDSLSVYVRECQPCYGELRKYRKTHKEAATKPENRPSDLEDPFPDGIPEAVAVGANIGDRSYNETFHPFLISDESPWRKGFGSSSDVLETRGPDGEMHGWVFLNTEIDPTVLVNLLNINKSCFSPKLFEEAQSVGMTKYQAALFAILYGVNGGLSHYDKYYYDSCLDVNRFENQDPIDLTGGTLRDRFDYDRAHLHEIFGVIEDTSSINPKIVEHLKNDPPENANSPYFAKRKDGWVEREKDFFVEWYEGQKEKSQWKPSGNQGETDE